jgi:hypothetical protein
LIERSSGFVTVCPEMTKLPAVFGVKLPNSKQPIAGSAAAARRIGVSGILRDSALPSLLLWLSQGSL